MRCSGVFHPERYLGRSGRFRVSVLLAALVFSALSSASAQGPTVEDLLARADDLFRGESSQGRMTMRVKTARWEREVSMSTWSKGSEKTLIRIDAPAKEKGTATLKVDKDIWNYLPKVDRTIKIPASMMAGAWMGSHFSNDDLVREYRFGEDFDCDFVEVEDRGNEHWTIRCVPKPDAPIVWGKVVVRIRKSDQLTDEITYWDDRDRLMRTATYGDIKNLGGQLVPTRIRIAPEDKPDEYTEIVYDELSFGIEIDDRVFSLQSLRR